MAGQDYVDAIFLGIVQGIAEFLPISSSGHLVILQNLLGHNSEVENLELNIALHLGTLFSIIVVYRAELFQVIRNRRLLAGIIVATLPLVLIGLFFKSSLAQIFGNPLVAGFGLLLTSVFLLLGQRLERRDALPSDRIGMLGALAVGLFQAVAIIPGVSRSGSTIAGGLIVGLDRDSAAKFSFLIAIPAIAGASVLLVSDSLQQSAGERVWGAYCVGAIVSFSVGYLSLRWLLSIVSRRKLHWFSAYCFVVGTATIVWQSWFGS